MTTKDNRTDLPAPGSPNFNQRVREELMKYMGRQGHPLDRGVTFRDLVMAGIVRLDGDIQSGGLVQLKPGDALVAKQDYDALLSKLGDQAIEVPVLPAPLPQYPNAEAPTPAPAPAPPPPPPPTGGSGYLFGSRLDLVDGAYPFGLMPTNFTTSELDTKVKNCYEIWKANMLRAAPTFSSYPQSVYGGAPVSGGYFIQLSESGSRGYVSEGMGYGALILVVMAGYDPNARTYFDGLFKVARAHPAYGWIDAGEPEGKYLMDWSVFRDMTSEGGGWPAHDGDLDLAMGLLMAHRQWGSNGEINYLEEAKNTINALKNVIWSPLGDPRYGQANGSTRTSDFMINHFRAFARATGDTFWSNTAIPRCETLITHIIDNYSPVPKLTPDFISNLNDGLGNPAEPFTIDTFHPYSGEYGPNAIRNPWRWGTDFLMTGNAYWGGRAADIVTWVKNDSGGDGFQTSENFLLDGTPVGARYFPGASAGGLMIGAMCGSDQAYLNHMVEGTFNNFRTWYYDADIQLLGLLVASGNWWQPL